MRALRILLADDHPIYRQGLRELLDGEPDFEVVGEAATGDEAVELARALAPDVALVDIHMPGVGGLAAAEQIRQELPGCALVLLAAQEDEGKLVEAANVGAAALFAKDVQPEEMKRALRQIARGQHPLDQSVLAKPVVASRLLREFRELALAKHRGMPDTTPVALSGREIEVLEYIARGSSNKEIARALKISDQTVKNHITSILRKLAVNDRTQAVVFALRQGWIKL